MLYKLLPIQGHLIITKTGHYYPISSVIRQSSFFFQDNPKDLDPSYQINLYLGLFWKGKTCIIAKLYRIHFVICSHSRKRQTVSNSRIQYFPTSNSLLNPIKNHLGFEMHVWVLLVELLPFYNFFLLLFTSLEARSGNILSFLLPLFQEGQLSVTGESMCMKYWLTA